MLLIINVALACKESYPLNENVTISDKMVSYGADADCNITLQYNNTILESHWMNKDGQVRYYDFGSDLEEGGYIASMECNQTVNTTVSNLFVGECKFIVGGKNRMIIGVIIMLPALFGLFMLLGSFFLGDEHVPLKLAMFLVTPIAFWASLHMGLISVIKFYDFTELQDLIGRTTYWTGMLFFVTLCYFLLYIFTKAIHTAAEKKKERLAY